MNREENRPTTVSIFKDESSRLALLMRLLPVFVLLSLGFAWKLWTSTRLYPLVPFLGLIPGIPFPLDYIVLGLFCIALSVYIFRPHAQYLNPVILVFFTGFFLQDQSRLWPSFYMYFFFFLLLSVYKNPKNKNEVDRVLNSMRFVVAAIYFWGGVQKLNPDFFHKEFPWFIEPVTNLLPFLIPYLPGLAVFAAVFEMLFGIGLLTQRFRNLALYEALLMHALILFCIGPFRNNWNNSSWVWGQIMAVQTGLLFYKAPAFHYKKMFASSYAASVPQGLAVILIGIMPVFNNINQWDAALSFNVYTGNVHYAQIHIRPDAIDAVPEALSSYVSEHTDRAVLDINAWSLHEFNANPYPEKRIFKAVLASICTHMPEGSVYLYVQEKSGWFFPKSTQIYSCKEV